VVIVATPPAVCVGDDFHTKVHLDSAGSSPELTLVYSQPGPDAGTLSHDWSFSGAVCKGLSTDPNPCDVIIDPGSVEPDGTVDLSDVYLTMLGDRPVFVTLTVTITYMGADGGMSFGASATAQTTIAIVPPDDAGGCPVSQGS
jgi:hypothetical protein